METESAEDRTQRIVQPKWSDDATVWRRYAGELRKMLGEANARVRSMNAAEVRAREAESRLKGARGRADRWKESFESLMRAKRRDGNLLDRVEQLLSGGDVPAAVDLLADRRRAIGERS